MSQVRKLMMAGGTFSVALGIGFVMQNGDALASKFGQSPAVEQSTAPEIVPVLVSATRIAPSSSVIVGSAPDLLSGPVIAVPAIATSTAAVMPATAAAPVLPQAPVLLAAAEPDPLAILPELNAVVATTCDPQMTSTLATGGMVDLAILATCHPDEALVLHHQGMMFTALTDATGTAEISVPALSEAAVFIASFADGTGAVATIDVPEVAGLDRAVLLWQGDSGLEIHAREFGAEYGSAGDVWQGAPRSTADLAMGEGFLVRLGEDAGPNPLKAEVYTFPTGQSAKTGEVILSVEAEITSANCGREISAQSIQIAPMADANAVDLVLTIPDCDTIGDFLVFKQMFNDLRVASN